MAEDKNIMGHIEELYDFMASKLKIKQKPEIELKHDEENAKDFYGKTAYYDPTEKKICLYVAGRHPKDIARSFAHELIHHMQNEKEPLQGKDLHATAEVGYAQKYPKLHALEQEAFTKGNMLFRQFTDERKMEMEKDVEQQELQEIFKKKKKLSPKELARKHAKAAVGGRSEGPGKEAINQSKVMKENKQKLPVDDRPHPEEMQERDAKLWSELLKKFKIPQKEESKE